MRIHTNCFEGYLTDKCHECPDWKDGSGNDQAIGCGARFPIALCPAFAEGGITPDGGAV